MTDDNSNPVDMNDLSSFEAVFYEKPEAKEPEAEVEENPVTEDQEEVEENEENPLATEDDDAEDETEEETPEEPEAEEKPKKRNRTQERIEKLVADARQAERERDALRIELERLRSEKVVPKEEPTPIQPSANAPKPDDLNEKGEDKYPLGSFDPLFIQDLTRFTVEQENKEADAKRAAQTKAQQDAEVRESIKANWQNNLVEAEKEIPEIRHNIENLVETFGSLEPNYGEYLATTLMSCENGPAIMNYLSQNIGEAQKIVASGPAAATLSIGALNARLAKVSTEEKTGNKQATNAPPPPPKTKGTSAHTPVRGDTSNLDEFEREFFSKK
jgi:hypothetical protein